MTQQRQQHQYFQGFIPPNAGQQATPQVTEQDMFLEIYNNWPHVRWTMDRHRNKDRYNVMQIDADWINFLTQKKIDIESFEGDKEKFAEKYIK